MAEQLDLFPYKVKENRKNRYETSRDVVFNDYDSFVKKFKKKDLPKTTDDCYTPQDVMEVVVDYVDSIYPLRSKKILRPFYPGGDYQRAYYPADGVVVDNPPFSILSKIIQFYQSRNIPYFLFCPGLTVFGYIKYGATAVLVRQISMTFDNGALVPINFVTNLLGDAAVVVAPRLLKAIKECPSQRKKASLIAKITRPRNLICPSNLSFYSNIDEDFTIKRSECEPMSSIGGKKFFGNNLLISDRVAERIEREREREREQNFLQLDYQTAKLLEMLNERTDTE